MKTDIFFNKERGIKSCISDGWRIFALNWRAYIKALWAYLIFTGMAGAFFVEMNVQYVCNHLLPALRLYQMKGNPEIIKMLAMPELSLLCYYILSAVVLGTALFCTHSRTIQLMLHYATEQALPQLPLPLLKEERATALRILKTNLSFGLLTAIITAGILAAAWKWQPWIALTLIPLYIYVSATANVCELQHALKCKSFKSSLVYALKHSMGLTFIIQFITFIPSALLCLVFIMPTCIYALTEWAGNNSMLMDDPSGLPSYLPFMFFILNAIGLACCAFVGSVRSWTLALKQ